MNLFKLSFVLYAIGTIGLAISVFIFKEYK